MALLAIDYYSKALIGLVWYRAAKALGLQIALSSRTLARPVEDQTRRASLFKKTQRGDAHPFLLA
jgi:hypothetical protein